MTDTPFEKFEDQLERTYDEAKARLDAERAAREAREAEFEARSFRLFEESGVYAESGYGVCTLAQLLSRLPAGVRPEDVILEYAGCGSHDVDVSWPQQDAPEGGPPAGPIEREWGHMTITAGELIERLAKLDPDRPITAQDGDGWYFNVVDLDDNEEQPSAILVTADDLDTRQW